MQKVLTPGFFNGPTLIIARELLGKFLVRKIGKEEIALPITEVEAYDGPHDKASHAHRGVTRRNKPMFGSAGYWYVYFVYGTHWMLNIVTGPEDYPAAVLIRGVESLNGPGKLTKFFKVDKKLNGKPAIPGTGLWIEDRGVKIKANQIVRLPRVGVNYAGQIWSKKLYRFVLK